MKKQPYLRSISIFPIKSCAGIVTTCAVLTPTGLQNDRELILVDDKTGDIITQREIPTMCRIATHIDGTILTVRAPNGMSDFTIDLSRPARIERPSERLKFFEREGGAFDQGTDAALWFSAAIGRQCRLMRRDKDNPRIRHSQLLNKDLPLGFQDGDQVSMLSLRSLQNLQSRSTLCIKPGRFRMNFLIDGLGAHEEDEAQAISIGDDAPLEHARLCVRCKMPNVDQDTGETGIEPMKTLGEYRGPKHVVPTPGEKTKGVTFGVNLASLVNTSVMIRTSDPLRIN